MANVTVKVIKPEGFRFKGEQLLEKEEVSMSAHAAATYVNLGWVKATGENREKVETFVEEREAEAEKVAMLPTNEKNSKAGPKGKK